jgi:hypothetical protein
MPYTESTTTHAASTSKGKVLHSLRDFTPEAMIFEEVSKIP